MRTVLALAFAGVASLIAMAGPAAPTEGQFIYRLPSTPAPGTAHIWVDTDGGTCADSATSIAYSDPAACGSIDAANDIADNGDTIIIKGGTYGAQTITGGNGRTSLATATVASGETATIDGTWQFTGARFLTVDGGGSRFTFTGARSGDASRLVMNEFGSDDKPAQPTDRFQCFTTGGSHQVTLTGAVCGGFRIDDSTFVTYSYTEFGPCYAIDSDAAGYPANGCNNGAIQYCEVAEIGCAGYNTDHTFEGNYVHDFGCDASFYSGGGGNDCHHECMYLSYAKNLTLRGNIFRRCGNGGNIFWTYSNGGGSFTADFGFTNVLVENNVFERTCNNSATEGCGSGRLDHALGISGHCNLYSGTDLTDVIIRFNTFLGGAGLDMNGGCTISNVQVYGNIRNGSSAACASDYPVAPVFSYELYYRYGFTCGGTGNVNLGDADNDLDLVVDGTDGGDATLVSSSTTASGKVPDATCVTTSDFEGTTRPDGTACDAGADER